MSKKNRDRRSFLTTVHGGWDRDLRGAGGFCLGRPAQGRARTHRWSQRRNPHGDPRHPQSGPEPHRVSPGHAEHPHRHALRSRRKAFRRRASSWLRGGKPKTETDLRRVLDDKNIDCVAIAMPNYWHALATVWACQAGKDVYVEKPATYCIAEGRRDDRRPRQIQPHCPGRHADAGQPGPPGGRQAAARRACSGRSTWSERSATSQRHSIGRKPDGAVPEGVHYDLWMGPSAKQTFNPNRFHYNWHWFWETGNGEIGNNGPHLADLVIHGLDRQDTLPVKISSQGGRFVWNDQGQTPNILTASYTYADGLCWSWRSATCRRTRRMTASEAAFFYGPKGYMMIECERGHYESVVDKKPGPSGRCPRRPRRS